MKSIAYPADERGGADHGWLKAKHTFSFASWYNPERTHFGAMRVLNDDWIDGGQGFGTHPHDNMEIITIPHTGALEHKDSMGNKGIIQSGDVQVMSAGSGIQHSEFNHSATEPCTLFQIWIFAKQRNVKPRYDQRSYNKKEFEGLFKTIVAPMDSEVEALKIHQDAFLSIGYFKAGEKINYQLQKPGNGIFVQNITGEFIAAATNFNRRDAVGFWETNEIGVEIKTNSQILIIEVPMEI